MTGGFHIVHTESSQGWGGQEIRILTESLGMMARGHRVTLLAPPRARIHEEARARGIPVEALPIEKKRLRGALALRSWLRGNRVDVINTHSSTDSWLVAMALLGQKQRPAVVRTRHISARLSANRMTRWLYTRGCNRVVTTGERLRQDLLEVIHAAPEHVLSVPTGIDLDRFNRREANRERMRQDLGLPRDAIVIGIAATLRSWKGHDYLLDAYAGLAPRMPGLHVLIAGDGPRREHLQQRIATLPGRERIHMLGHREDMPAILAAMDVFALPSYANEGVPQAIMQAMALSLPVVSTSVGAIGEAVRDGETGMLVRPRDAGGLAGALERLASDPALRARMGQAGRERAERCFSLDAMLDRMEQVFATAVQARRAAPRDPRTER